MGTEIFRFVNLRGPRLGEREPGSGSVILASGKPSPLLADLARVGRR